MTVRLRRTLKLTPAILDIDFSEAQTRICRFIKEYVENAGAKGIVLGLIRWSGQCNRSCPIKPCHRRRKRLGAADAREGNL